jgi:hypothetical protein
LYRILDKFRSIRVIGDPDNQRVDKWSFTVFGLVGYDAASLADWFPTFRNSAVVATTLYMSGTYCPVTRRGVREERIRHLQHCKNPLVHETIARFFYTPEWRWTYFSMQFLRYLLFWGMLCGVDW